MFAFDDDAGMPVSFALWRQVITIARPFMSFVACCMKDRASTATRGYNRTDDEASLLEEAGVKPGPAQRLRGRQHSPQNAQL